ncbi:MAG: 30S ribosome-binding factor RbfA [Anaerolinea sp.]|nr:30S ribosome-binding factor RbfA [Anaerolinea sp.]
MSIKQARMSGRIRKILSELLLREVSDPRLNGLTVTDVELDPELLYARIKVNALGEEERKEEVLFALEHAKGFLRREVAKRVRLRKAPDLIFRWDASLERGERITRLINSLEIPPEEAMPDDEMDDKDNDDDQLD